MGNGAYSSPILSNLDFAVGVRDAVNNVHRQIRKRLLAVTLCIDTSRGAQAVQRPSQTACAREAHLPD